MGQLGAEFQDLLRAKRARQASELDPWLPPGLEAPSPVSQDPSVWALLVPVRCIFFKYFQDLPKAPGINVHHIFSRSSSSEKLDEHAEGATDADDDDEVGAAELELAPRRNMPSSCALDHCKAVQRFESSVPSHCGATEGSVRSWRPCVPTFRRQTFLLQMIDPCC